MFISCLGRFRTFAFVISLSFSPSLTFSPASLSLNINFVFTPVAIYRDEAACGALPQSFVRLSSRTGS